MKHVITLLLALVSVFMLYCEEKEPVLQTHTIDATNVADIVPVDSSLVKPILYQSLPPFDDLTVEDSKSKFIAAVLPSILVAQHNLVEQKAQILQLKQKEVWTTEDSSIYLTQMERFNAQTLDGLIKRMITLPPSLVLAQAAVESGWGSSRFFREGNNLFGIWSYNANEPRIEAKLDRGETSIYVRKYADISSSITDYFETLGRARAYRYLRTAAAETSDASELLPHLKYYSERREAYVEQLRTIIEQNDLYQYDHYQIDPAYFVTP